MLSLLTRASRLRSGRALAVALRCLHVSSSASSFASSSSSTSSSSSASCASSLPNGAGIRESGKSVSLWSSRATILPLTTFCGSRWLASSASSASSLPWPDVDKDYVSNVISEKPQGVWIVDVRERTELTHGAIPSAIVIPLSEIQAALRLSDDQFEQQYGRSKPDEEDELIMYCRSGARADTACAVAVEEGFENVKNYRGSYIDWFGKTYEL